MWPILLSLGPVRIYSFGVFMAIGLFLSLYFWWKMGRDEHWEEISLFDGFFLSLIVYLIAGRVAYVAMHIDQFASWVQAVAILAHTGINAVVGVGGVVVTLLLFARERGWEYWKVLDAMVVALSLCLIFGSLGGLLSGHNAGLEVSWGVIYSGQTAKAIPVDAWNLVWAIITFGVVSRVRKNFRFYSWYKGESSTAQDGLATLIFVIMVGLYYAVASWIDRVTWNVGPLPVEFVIGLVTMLASTYLINRRIGRRDDTIWSKLISVIRRK